MSRTQLPIDFLVQRRKVRGETLYSDVGPQILALTSCSADLGLELRGAYLAGEGRDQILVAESAVLGAGAAELGSRLVAQPAAALVYRRRHLLYDHLQQLQDLALSRGTQLSFEGVDAATVQLDPDPRDSSLSR